MDEVLDAFEIRIGYFGEELLRDIMQDICILYEKLNRGGKETELLNCILDADLILLKNMLSECNTHIRKREKLN